MFMSIVNFFCRGWERVDVRYGIGLRWWFSWGSLEL